jgi:hypothetical protein
MEAGFVHRTPLFISSLLEISTKGQIHIFAEIPGRGNSTPFTSIYLYINEQEFLPVSSDFRFDSGF